jgi:hypothetical protein
MRPNLPRAGSRSAPLCRVPILPAIVLIAAVVGCSVYANLSFLVTSKADYRFFPPFERYVNANRNDHLGGEYFNMARSLVAGEGFAHPFDRRTDLTAWQPPVLPVILAGFLWMCDGSRTEVMKVVVVLQVCVLIGTGLLILALAEGKGRLGPWMALAVFLAGLLCHFHPCFQFTHDCWLVGDLSRASRIMWGLRHDASKAGGKVGL